MKRTIVLCFLFMATIMFGLDTVRAASDPRSMQLTYEPWVKTCLNQPDGNSTCFIATGARGGCDPSGGSFLVIVRHDKSPEISIRFITKHTLEGTVSIQIDQGAPILIPHSECTELSYGLSCGGKFEIDGAFVERLKHARTITIEAKNSAHQPSLSFSLADFSKAFDGPGTEPKVFEETAEKLKEELAKRAEEQKALECKE